MHVAIGLFHSETEPWSVTQVVSLLTLNDSALEMQKHHLHQTIVGNMNLPTASRCRQR